MTCQWTTPVPGRGIPLERHNEVLSQLDAEKRARAVVEAELAEAKEDVAYLRATVARISACKHCSETSATQSGTSRIHTGSSSVDDAQQLTNSDNRNGAKAQTIESPQNTSPSESGDKHDACKQDKEILSHCSDISASKTENRSDGGQRRKTKTSLSQSVRKTTKTKKERGAKVKVPGQSRYWTPVEHKLFLEALNKYGHKDLRAISSHVGTRNMTQVRTHSQKYFMRLMREAKRQNPTSTSPAAEDGKGPAGATSTPSVHQSSGDGVVSSSEVATDNQSKVVDLNGDKYSVPNTCGMTLLCLVGQDTLTS